VASALLAKGAGKAMSYALKVCLLQTFLIPTEEDKDPDAQTTTWATKQSVKDINAEMVKRGAIQVPAAKPKQERETAQDERDLITNCGGPTYSVGGVRQMQALVESDECYEYPKHRDLVVEAASQLKISKPRIAAHRDQLNAFLATAAYGNLESIKNAMSTYFAQQENNK
jgi:hypothetical protein